MRLTPVQLAIQFLREKHCNFTAIAKIMNRTKEEIVKEVRKTEKKLEKVKGFRTSILMGVKYRHFYMEGVEVSTRLYCALKENGLTLAKATAMQDLDLLQIRGVGVKTVRELRICKVVKKIKK